MCKIKQLYVIIFFGICFLTNAQSLKFENYTTKNGLISDEVYKIFQDKRGYIWMFTNYGTMKYNGKKFELTLKNLPFGESFIYSFFENDEGQLWVANSNAKIFEIKNDSAFIVKGTEEISEKFKKNIAEIFQLFVDDSLNIYAVTKLYTYKFIQKKNYEGLNLSTQSSEDSSIYKVVCFNNNLLPIYFDPPKKHTKGFFLINKKIKTKIKKCTNVEKVYNLPSSVLSGPKLFKQFGSDIYLSFYNKIVKLNSNEKITEIPFNALITNFIKDKNNHLWVGCVNNGLFELDEKDSIINHYFKDKTINDILIDSQNGLWVTTARFGIYHCRGSNSFFFNEDEPLGLPLSFIKKIDNKLFAFNDQGDLSIIGKSGIKSIIESKDRKSAPLDIVKYHSLFLISYRHKTEYLDIEKGVVKTILPQEKKFFAPFKYILLSNDTLLLVNRNGIMILYNDSVLKKYEFSFKTYDCIVRNNRIIIATENGIFELLNDKLFRPIYFKISEKSVVTKIVKGSFNDIWFCTKGFGLYKLTDENEVIHYTVENGLPSNIINDISFNTDHSILLSTNTGLYHSSKYKKWIEIYPEQVQSAIEFKNDIYLSTKNGLVIAKDIKRNEQQPIYFNLASVLINGIKTNQQQFLKLDHNQNSLEFNFDIISFSSSIPDVIYQLNGKTNHVAITKNQQIVFQNLSPGSYTLTAALTAQHNQSTPIVISFCIIPAFWQTKWFIISCVVCCLIFCTYVGSRIFKYYKYKENKKNEAKRLITEYKLIALKAQINPHFMSNCLTAIQHLIISGKVDEANQYLAKFSLLVRQVLNFSSKPLVTLKEELEITEINIELEQLRFENKFLFEIVSDKKLNLNTVFVPPLILQPIVENAIWHGLLPLKKTRSGKLCIKIQIEENLLYIHIEDNGVGRKRTGGSIGNLKDSKGIAITKQRIHNLNEFYNSNKADVIYSDLIDASNHSIGTLVTIVLPLNLKQE